MSASVISSFESGAVFTLIWILYFVLLFFVQSGTIAVAFSSTFRLQQTRGGKKPTAFEVQHDAHFGFAASETGLDRTPFRHTHTVVGGYHYHVTVSSGSFSVFWATVISQKSNYVPLPVQDLNA